VEGVRKDVGSHAAQNVSRFLTSLQEPFDSLNDRLDDIEYDLEYLGHDLSDLEIARRNKSIFQWLSKVNYPKHHESALEGLLQSSASWFLNKPEYIGWESFSKPSIIWLHGIPGSGKTKIIATVVERLIRSHSTSDSTMLAYFYCSRNTDEKERAEPDFILRSILKQLCCTELEDPISKDVVGAYVARYRDAEKIGCDPLPLSLDEATDLIIKLSNTRPAIIILDALDECNNERRQKLMVALDRIIRKSEKPVRILVSSRDDDDIVCKLENSPNIYISSTDNQDDIARFIDQELEWSIKERSLLRGDVTETLRLRITDTLLRGAQGM
jgi:nucleoside-triphosphatase THEP1